MDELSLESLVEFLPQKFNERFNYIALRVKVHIPNMFLESFA